MGTGLSLVDFTSLAEGDLVETISMTETVCLSLLVMVPLAGVDFTVADGVV